MSLSLSTRGYLCPQFTIQVLQGAGPEILDSQVLSPEVDGARAIEAEGPTITGSIAPGPDVSGASTEEEVGVEAPSISGSDKPEIG